MRATLNGNINGGASETRSIIDNGASARICVDHELLNGNGVSLFMSKIAALSRGVGGRLDAAGYYYCTGGVR